MGLELATQIELRLLSRNQLFESFFAREARTLAEACREMSERFLRGGRLLAFGRGPYATDAQHVSVEFVHPVIVGKRALPALDLSLAFEPWLKTLVQADDIVMGFGPPEGDPEVWDALEVARQRNAMTFALPGVEGSYFAAAATQNPFIHQELNEILYHTLWETVHVFFEHRELGHDVGEAAFLYPFLGKEKQQTFDVTAEAAASIEMKVRDDALLRARVAQEESEKIGEATMAICQRVEKGGKLILWQGWSDQRISPMNTIAYYQALNKQMGTAAVDSFTRLFLFPGIYHCGGGEGYTQFDLLSPLMAWVEGGDAPSRIIAAKVSLGPHVYTPPPLPQPGGTPIATRPVFAYPMVATYSGHGDVNDAASYVPVRSQMADVPARDWEGASLYAPSFLKSYTVVDGKLTISHTK